MVPFVVVGGRDVIFTFTIRSGAIATAGQSGLTGGGGETTFALYGVDGPEGRHGHDQFRVRCVFEDEAWSPTCTAVLRDCGETEKGV